MMKVTTVLLSLVIVAGCSSNRTDSPVAPPSDRVGAATISEAEIGLAPGSVFEQPKQTPVEFNTADPGESEPAPRPNAEFPPVIPHSIENFGTISLDYNPCLQCHNADVAEEMGAVAVPASHRRDLRNSPDVVGDGVTGARLVCTSCHVGLTDEKPVVRRMGRSTD